VDCEFVNVYNTHTADAPELSLYHFTQQLKKTTRAALPIDGMHCCQGITQFYLPPALLAMEWDEPYLPLPFQPVFINQPGGMEG